MSGQDTDTQVLEKTAPDPAHGPDPESNPTSTPVLDLAQTVSLSDGRRVTLGDLLKVQEEVESLREYRDLARKIVTNDGTIDEDYEIAARHIMYDAGFEPDQIDEWVEAQKQAARGGGVVPFEDEEYMSDTNRQQAPTDDGLRREIEALKAELREVRSRAEGTDVRTLEQALSEKVSGAVSSEELARVLDRINDLGGDPEARKKFAQDEIRRITLENIKRRRSSGAQFNPQWFDEETQKAAKEVADKFRTVIGDPDKLRRAPETDAGQDWLIPRGPVKDPDLPKNADISQRISEAQRFGTEKLLEGLRVGGASKT